MPTATPPKKRPSRRPPPSWGFFSRHALVLVRIAREPESRLRDLAEHVGVTERAVQSLVADLVKHEYLAIVKNGRRNRYRVNLRRILHDPLAGRMTVRRFLETLVGELP